MFFCLCLGVTGKCHSCASSCTCFAHSAVKFLLAVLGLVSTTQFCATKLSMLLTMLGGGCRFYLLFGLITAHYSAYNTQHIHHFYLGWSVALFAEFNHPISLATLAIAMGVFAQGVGVYGFASLFEDSSCFTATADSTQMTCDFTSTAAALTVRVCPQAASAFQHSCFYTSGF